MRLITMVASLTIESSTYEVGNRDSARPNYRHINIEPQARRCCWHDLQLTTLAGQLDFVVNSDYERTAWQQHYDRQQKVQGFRAGVETGTMKTEVVWSTIISLKARIQGWLLDKESPCWK